MPTEFGKYLLQRKLAEGGMAEVFLARQSGMDGFEKPVVIKRILPHLSGESQFVNMFLNEAKVAARLSHPAIVQIFDFGRIDDQYFIAMEFIHGEDLRHIAKVAGTKRKRPSPPLLARIFADVLGGLHYAHTRSGPDGKKLGLVHRDVSPQNVLVTYEGGVKLVDFGIAKATFGQQGQQTQAGLLKGKYAYMSPEQCRGRGLDARSDVFAAGILLWELLTWKRLFRRESDLTTLVAVAEEPIPRLAQLRPDLPTDLDRIVSRALARPIDERYPSAQAMQADLEGLIRKQGWEADSIRLQQYMRDLFADKLALQDEALRAAGVGSIDDFLVRVDDGTRVSWMEQEEPPSARGLELPSATPVSVVSVPPRAPGLRSPTRPSLPAVAAVPGPGSRAPSGVAFPAVPMAQVAEGSGASVVRLANGQSVPRSDTGIELPPSRWRRLAVIGASSTIFASAGLAALLWPGLGDPAESPLAAARSPAVAQATAGAAKIRVILDQPGTVMVDGVAQPPARETEVTVTAGVEHDLRVRGGEVERKMIVPPLDPGAVQTIRMRLGLGM